VFIFTLFTACNNESENRFKLKGTLEGITDGIIILSSADNIKQPADTFKIENGKFVVVGNIPKPSMYYLQVEKRTRVMFYAENARMTLKGHADSMGRSVIKGGKTQTLYSEFRRKVKELAVKHKVDDLRKELYMKTAERDIEITRLLGKYDDEVYQLQIDFIKEHPKAYYSVELVYQMSIGKNAVEIERYLNMLDKKFAGYSEVVSLGEYMKKIKTIEVKVESLLSDAHNLSYKVDESFVCKEHNNIGYLSVLSNGNVCALKKDGRVLIIDSCGKMVKEFKSNIKKPSAIAVDKSDNIYVMGSIIGKKRVESRGRNNEIEVPVAVSCFIFNTKGSKIRDLRLEDVTQATGAKIFENNLIVADSDKRLIAVFDAETGLKKWTIEKLYTCCNILDFCVRKENEILVAHLAIFRVDGYDYSGKRLYSFGQRGNTINDFHGCCNPVSVAFLSNGGIVTVEKDPTRIKVYSMEGAKKVEGIDELVKGCAYIPIATDKRDNVYLASYAGGLMKCIPSNRGTQF
jgi:hypothetical protein